MQFDHEKLKELIKQESKDLRFFAASSFFIGEINGYPVMVSVMQKCEAISSHDYDGLESIPENLVCIKD